MGNPWLKDSQEGRIGIVASGSGLVGEAVLTDCIRVGKFDRVRGTLKPWSDAPQDKQSFVGRRANFTKHRIRNLRIIKYANVFACVLDNVVKYETHLPRPLKRGPVIWLKLSIEAWARFFSARNNSVLLFGAPLAFCQGALSALMVFLHKLSADAPHVVVLPV